MAILGTVIVAKKKTGAGAKKAAAPAIAVTLRGSPEWKAWVEGFAEDRRLDVAKLIDRALIEYAKAEGYTPKAPPR
jgi:hypothetical protein